MFHKKLTELEIFFYRTFLYDSKEEKKVIKNIFMLLQNIKF